MQENLPVAAAKDLLFIDLKSDMETLLKFTKYVAENIVLSDFGDLVASDSEGINLFESYTNSKIIFLFLDSRRYGETTKTIGKFILQDLKSVSARVDSDLPKEERKPFSVIIDEFADLASKESIMTEQRPKIGKKGAGREIAKKLSEMRRKPLSQKILNIISEISEREQKKQKDEKKIVKSTDAEI